MGSRAKYRKLPDLYVRGTELPFEDGTVMWLQVMNPFELEEARRDAQVAKARFILAMKEVGSPDYDNLRGVFAARSTDQIVDEICDIYYPEHFTKAMESVETDSEWKERVEVLRRADEVINLPEEDPEHKLLTKINTDWLTEVNKRVQDEQDYLRRELEALEVDQLFERYEEQWVERRGTAIAMSAYNLAEVFYSCRVCDAVKTDDGYNHDACDHKMRVWETKEEIKELPEELFTVVRQGLTAVSMTVREAKNSDRLLSSSASSQQPNQVEESTASTQTEIQLVAPGI